MEKLLKSGDKVISKKKRKEVLYLSNYAPKDFGSAKITHTKDGG